MFRKIGEAIEINPYSIQAASSIPDIDPATLAEMTKYATELRRIAPKANDFLYFSAVMMHAAERVILEKDGSPKLGKDGHPLEAHWDVDANGSWKWVCSDPTVKPFKNCFPPGTHITMEDGSVKNIEDIKVGDVVITHTGSAKKVLRTFTTPHDGDLVKFNLRQNQALVCTDNHPIYHVEMDDYYSKGLGSLTERKKNNGKYQAQYKFSPAESLEVGDLLLSPVLHTKVDSYLNPNRARLLGVYAAEGSFSKKYDKLQAVRFTIGITETKQAQLLHDLFQEEFPECSVSIHPEPSRSIIEVSASGHNIADYFYHHCGEYSHTKILSKELVFGTDDVKRSFLAGWIDGDGCKERGTNKLIGITVSPHLANQIRLMVNSLGVSNALRKTNVGTRKFVLNGKEYPCKDNYRLEWYGDSYKKLKLDELSIKYEFDNDMRTKLFSSFEDDYGLHSIRSIERVQYTGDVHNFEVEDDHSYVANGVVVSNCNGDIFPESQLIEAYKKWIGKPLCVDHKSSSVEHTRGFIVDTYYDRNLKRVVALCALDKLNYPDLAHGVSTGYKNAVSMGTGVERAICYDCGRVARAEADFCKHMKTKSGYGEINCGLNPLELSLVVNGADGDAKVKDIVAMVDTLNAYVDGQQRKLAKLAAKYTANLSYDTGEEGDTTNKHSGTVSLAANDLVELENGIHKAISDFAAITKEKTLLDSNNAAYTQTGSASAMLGTDNSGTDFSLAPPNGKFAMTDEQNKQLLQTMSSIDAKLTKIQQDYETLATTKHEDTMSGTNVKQGYYQGGGGLNEPTPGKVKYPIDPLNIQDRDHHDKQMVGQKPFPDVGKVDELYPGYDSFPMGELERKQMLLRAEQEERAMQRTAVVQKAKDALAYFQNGLEAGNVNTPAPHKVKYPIDKLNEEDRNKHDKQMVGQKPFPDVGPVDGMHPSPDSADVRDEFKRKQLLQRAGLKARFTKSADLGASTWQVFGEDEKLLLSKTVDELTQGRTSELYAGVATEAFAKDLMSKIRAMGVEKVSALFKSAQVPPMSPMGDAPALPAPGGDAPEPGKDGDAKESVPEMAKQLHGLAGDLLEAVTTMDGAHPDMESGPMAASDSKSMSSTASFQNEIAKELTEKMLASAEALTSHENELKAVARLYQNDSITASNKDYLTAEINETVSEAKKAFADGLEIMNAYIKFAEAVDEIEKRANTLGEDTMQPENKEIMGMLGETDAGLRELASSLEEGELTVEAKEESCDEDSGSADDLATLLADDFAADDAEDDSDAKDSEDSSDSDDNAAVKVPDIKTAIDLANQNKDVEVEVAKKASLEDRVALRAKIASEMDKISPIFYDFHPKGGETPSGSPGSALKTQDELAKVEDLEEKHDKIMDVVHAVPAAVKKQAAEINDLIKAGKLTAESVDQLASFGVDPAAVKYWHELYNEMGPEGKTFANDLLKEHAGKKAEDEMAKYRVKLARSYELAYDHRDAGLISEGRESVEACVNELMEMNDPAFDTVKKVVARHAPAMKKQASIPQVGMTSLFDEPAPQLQDLRAQLDAAFSNSKPRSF